MFDLYLPKPHHDDEEVQERIDVYYRIVTSCGFLAAIIILVCAVSPLFTLDFTFQDFLTISLAPILLFLGCILCYFYLLKLELDKSLWVFVGMIIFAYSTALLISPDGIYDPGLYASTMVMVVLGYYGSDRSLTVFTAAMIILIGVEFSLEVNGIKETNHPPPPILHLIQYTLFLLMIRWFVSVSVKKLKNRTRQYRDSRDELAIYQVELEHLVEKRTAQLEVEKKKTVEASSAKSSYMANMSHELRTPLNAIIGYSEMIKDELIDAKTEPDLTDDLDKVTGAAKGLLKLINEILDFSKAEAQEMVFDIQKCPVLDIVEEVHALLYPLFAQNGNRFGITPVDSQLYVWGDSQKIRQVLINLLNNANKYTESGEIYLSIESTDDSIQFIVADTGMGIDAKFLPHLFEPFKQQPGEQNKRIEGTGLGLAITQKFVLMMNGNIKVRSVLGKGTTFYVELPRVQNLRMDERERKKLVSEY